MGRLEKIVVLTVLFLVAVILAVSLNRDEVVAGPQDPLAAAPQETEVVQAPSLDNRLLSAQVAASEGAQPVEPEPEPETEVAPIVPAGDGAAAQGTGGAPSGAAPAVERPAPAEPRPLLRTSEGLTASLVPELRLYTWQEGDTFTALADRYYGSRLEVGRLRDANEGRDESTIRPGEQVFVPVEAVEPGERLGRSSAEAGQWHGGVYVVQSGDMLSKIAQKTYGSAGQWRRIYDANRDVLASPDALKVGMRLRIPAE